MKTKLGTNNEQISVAMFRFGWFVIIIDINDGNLI